MLLVVIVSKQYITAYNSCQSEYCRKLEKTDKNLKKPAAVRDFSFVSLFPSIVQGRGSRWFVLHSRTRWLSGRSRECQLHFVNSFFLQLYPSKRRACPDETRLYREKMRRWLSEYPSGTMKTASVREIRGRYFRIPGRMEENIRADRNRSEGPGKNV